MPDHARPARLACLSCASLACSSCRVLAFAGPCPGACMSWPSPCDWQGVADRWASHLDQLLRCSLSPLVAACRHHGRLCTESRDCAHHGIEPHRHCAVFYDHRRHLLALVACHGIACRIAGRSWHRAQMWHDAMRAMPRYRKGYASLALGYAASFFAFRKHSACESLSV